jgi:hypothetical protein
LALAWKVLGVENMFILGFTDEDVTVGWQHWRLARECGGAFEAEGIPSFGVLETAGEGRYLVQWYLCSEAADVLDRHGVDWRRFLIGEEAAAPPNAYPPNIPSTREQSETLERRRVIFK